MSPADDANRERTIVLCGPSVRAFVHSAVAAGFRVAAVDDYLDLDLVDRVVWFERTPVDEAGFEEIFGRRSPTAWSYGGGWENRPALIERLSALAPLWGTSPEAFRVARDPFTWSAELADAGFLVPAMRPVGTSGRHPAGVASYERWLSKRIAGTNGGHVRWTAPDERDDGDGDGARYLQAFVPGRVESAEYVASPRGAEFLGLCVQLIGDVDLGAGGFGYAGAVGPVPVDASEADFFARLGEAVAALGPLRGLFGVDGVRRSDGRWLPIEINPRYTASMESIELATGRSFFADLAAAFGEEAASAGSASRPPASSRLVGKGVLFARCTMELPFDRDDWRSFEAAFPGVRLADLPQPGTVIRAGEPTLTLHVAGSDVEDAIHRVRSEGRRVEAELRRRFEVPA